MYDYDFFKYVFAKPMAKSYRHRQHNPQDITTHSEPKKCGPPRTITESTTRNDIQYEQILEIIAKFRITHIYLIHHPITYLKKFLTLIRYCNFAKCLECSDWRACSAELALGGTDGLSYLIKCIESVAEPLCCWTSGNYSFIIGLLCPEERDGVGVLIKPDIQNSVDSKQQSDN